MQMIRYKCRRKPKVSINEINIIKNKIALAVKDGSKASFNNINFKNNIYDIALFNKKRI